MFAACCCSDQNHGAVVNVEASNSSVPAPQVTDVDEVDAPAGRCLVVPVVEEESQLDSPPAVAAGPVVGKPDRSSDVVSEVLEFEATLHKSAGEKLGLDISAYDGKTLLVGKVKAGPVERWNAQHEGNWERCILRGDRIVTVNGIRDNSDELLGAARVDLLNVTVRRRVEFAVTVAYDAGDEFGLDFQDSPDGRVVISRVDEGVVAEANPLHPADIEIRPGDQVLHISAASGEGIDALRTAMAACTSSNVAGAVLFRIRRGKLICIEPPFPET